MKIQNGTQGHGLPDKPSRVTKPTGDTAFKTHLDNALVRKDFEDKPSLSVTAKPSPGVVTPMSGIGAQPQGVVQGVVQGLEDFLGTLEVYQKRLGDARIDLKTLAQDLDRIGAQCHQLDKWSRSAMIDDDLRGMLQAGLTTARVEMARFYAGEYV